MATALAARGDRINPAVSGRYCPSLPRYYIRVCYIAAASRSIALDKIKLIFSLYSLYSSFYLFPCTLVFVLVFGASVVNQTISSVNIVSIEGDFCVR